MAYTPLHKYLHGIGGKMLLTMEAVGRAEGGSVDRGNMHGYGDSVLGWS
jgi:hypothetical protein